MNLKNKNKQFFSAFSLSILVSGMLYADVSGVVFQDIPVNGTSLNSYGVKDANEIGVANITVTAYPGGATTTTDATGAWTLASSSDVRVEFSNIPSHLKESVDGGAKNSSVQFIANGGTADFALHDVNDYSNVAQPPYATNILSSGSNIDSTIPSLVTNQYADSGLNSEFKTNNDVQGTGPVPVTDAEAKEIGAVWGKGFQTSKQRMFISSVLWRHIGFANGSPSKIFVADYSTSPVTILGNIDLQDKSGIDLGSVDRSSGSDYTLPDNPMTPSVDLDAYAKIGKISYGDLDFDNNTETIWTVNLNQKALISVDASGDYASLSSATVNQYLIENLNGVPTCIGGELRPWGLGIHNGKGYLGSICDASTSQSTSDLKAYVSTFDLANPSSGLTTVFSMDMDYDRSADDGYSENPNFFPWSDSIHDTASTNWDGYNQPILVDIDFDEKGNLYLGVMDRYGLQIGMSNYTAESGSTSTKEKSYGQGEILKVCNSNGTYELEGTGACAEGTTPDKDFFDDRGGDNNANPSGGAMAILKGSEQMLLVVNDPHPAGDTGSDYWTTNGVQTFNTITGANENWYSHIDSSSIQYTGKAAGLGDIEFLTAASPIEIGNRVWEDTDSDGVQDADEVGISGVTVELVCGGAIASTATTDVDGTYIFSTDPSGTSTASHKYNLASLVAGSSDCLVRVPNVTGTSKQASLGIVSLTIANGGEGSNANSNDSDGVAVGDNADASILATDIPVSGANNHSFDFGFSPKETVSIGSLVWEDKNNDGLQDEGESGIADVNVTLLDENGTVMSNPVQKTLENGQYYFSGLDEGSYSILVSPPTGMGYVPCVTQTTADNNDTENDSNIKEPKDGGYVSGQFTLEVDNEPEEGNLGADGKSGTDSADDTDDNNGNMTVDFCFYRPASLGDYVWYDENKDGIQDATEKGVEGVSVKLLKDCITDTNTTITTITNDEGKYLFPNLDAGDYCVEFILPVDMMVTTPNATDDDKDSDTPTSTPYQTMVTTLDAGEKDMSWDMGIHSNKATIGDTVWYDNNANGIQDAGETGVNDVTVKLYNGDCETQAKDGQGVDIADVETDENGKYIFSSLIPNDYCVGFDLSTLPSEYKVSPKKAGADDALNSDADVETGITESTNLVEGENDTTWDMGIYLPASIGNFVWLDSNADGIQDAGEPGVANVTVTLYDDTCGVAITTDNDNNPIVPIVTGGNGEYGFSNLIPGKYCVGFEKLPAEHIITKMNQGNDLLDSDVNPASRKTIATELESGENDPTWDMGIYLPASIGNKVWLDSNGNGQQDSNESGVENVVVNLYKSDCSTPVTKDDSGAAITFVTTDSNGLYSFNNLTPNDYCVGFTVPNGYVVTQQDSGLDSSDSDVNPVTGKAVSTTLVSGENDLTWDLGIYKPASIGNLVWNDINADGIQDAGEVGLQDVTVTLYNCDCTTVAKDNNGVALPTVQTDSNGIYSFNNLRPQDYCVGFTVPTGYSVSPQSATTDDTLDSDVDVLTHKAACTTLNMDENDTSWDMGVYESASIGNLVWLDDNRDGLQSAGEAGVKDITVKLLKDCTTVIKSTTTDANGNYLFTDLIPADYCVEFTKPSGYSLTFKDAGDDEKDSDADRVSFKTEKTTLVGGENDLTWDMGLYELSSLGNFVWYDNIKNGIQDSNETGVSDVNVTLYTDCNTTRRVLSATQTDANGYYLFENLEPNGDYCIGFENLPEGYQFTVDPEHNLSSTLECIVDTSTGITQDINLPHATNDLTWDMGIIPKCTDEEGRHLEIHDDSVVASTLGATTTIDILENDFGNLDIESIKFIKTEEGEVLYESGTAVAGTNTETFDELVVEGEGVWKILADGKITFTAETGFIGVPTPVYYIVQCKQGTVSNVAKASITSNCVCDPYEESVSDSVASLSEFSMVLLLVLTSTFSLFFFRRELEEKFV